MHCDCDHELLVDFVQTMFDPNLKGQSQESFFAIRATSVNVFCQKAFKTSNCRTGRANLKLMVFLFKTEVVNSF